MIIKRKAKIDIPPLEPDTYGGTLVGIVDVGEQEYQGKYRRQCILVFEVDGESVEVDGQMQPRWLSRIFTASIDKKSNLYAVLTSWKGVDIDDEEFDLSLMLGSPAMLAVSARTSKDGSLYNFIDGVMRPPRSMRISPAQTAPFEFDMDSPDTWDALETLPEWMRAMIERSPTWAELQASQGAQLTPDDAMPKGEAPEKSAGREPAF